MPHSSGGGSHGGGSHHSSHSHSSGGGSSTRSARTSRSYFAGSHRYVYYRHHRPVYYYSDRAPEKKVSLKWTLIIGIACLIAVNLLYGPDVIHNPKKLKVDYEAQVGVYDDLDIMTDTEEAELTGVLQSFLELTGITPVVMTKSNDVWVGNYNTLSNYAYDVYVNTWVDEKHWLLVYTGPSSKGAADFDNWYWEGMQGDDTDPILIENKVDDFTDELTKYLTMRSQYTVGQSFSTALRNLTGHVMKPGLSTEGLSDLLLMNGVVLLFFIPSLLSGISNNRRAGAVRCQTDQGETKEDTCEYCGGLYVHGLHLSCPHCGAPVKPENAEGQNADIST